MKSFIPLPLATCLIAGGPHWGIAQSAPPASAAPKTLHTPRQFPEIATPGEWHNRAREIREQALVSCGLWPMPEKTPLRARIFGRIERDGYSVEKVFFQTVPGFYLAGNLYRPSGKGGGPFPGILNPHGHWKEGRFADNKDGSIAARCISLARQGMVAFSYDMAGYNDTAQVNHQFARDPANQLWNINLMGLQTWNSIRALDFLESLPDVDRQRFACTGESGGGTQTFMLGAIDHRLAAQAPIVMVSHSMQGGCLCENAPGLRVEFSNMEIAAAAAPRPQMIVAASGDWTKATMEVEGPAIARIYELLGARDRFDYALFDFGHNYNQTSREAVYARFGKWLLPDSEPASWKEAPYTKEPNDILRVFPDGKPPGDALGEPELIARLIERSEEQLQALRPRNTLELDGFKEALFPAWRRTLQVSWPVSNTRLRFGPVRDASDYLAAELQLSHPEPGGTVEAIYFKPPPSKRKPAPTQTLVVLAGEGEQLARWDNFGTPAGLAQALVANGHSVLVIRGFSPTITVTNQFANYFTTYNRTLAQQRVRDLISACSLQSPLGNAGGKHQVVLCGSGRAGLWALLAAPAAHAVIADANALNWYDDESLLHPNIFMPGLRKLGGFDTAASLAAPHPLLLHHTGDAFPTETMRAAYQSVRASARLRIQSRPATDEELVKWISQL